MEEYEEGLFSIGCGNCDMCPYRVKCSEYNNYMMFHMGVKKEAKLISFGAFFDIL